MRPKINRKFVSEIDQFLAEFDKTHPQKSVSQLEEIKKHEQIFKLRDGVVKKKSDLLKDF